MSAQEQREEGAAARSGVTMGGDPFAIARRLRQAAGRRFRRPQLVDLAMLARLAAVIVVASVGALLLLTSIAYAMPLSAGDRVQLVVASGEEFSGKYQVDVGGRIALPYAGPVAVAGLEPEAAAAAIADRLVEAGLFRSAFVRTSLLVLAWAPVEVRVSGAVFAAGVHRVNLPPARDRAPDRGDELPGAALPERRLSDALRAAGGVTPWADVRHIAVRRAGVTRLYDLWGLLLGEPTDDPALQSGDEVLVPVLDAPQPALARPSSITPPGIKVFVSNLIQPVQGNAQATVSLAYGSRFSQAVVAANCVGGIGATSAGRSAVLVRTDRLSGKTRTWDSPVEELVREGSEARNPLLLEGDAVSCYDSGMTTLRDVLRTIAEVVLPFSLLRWGRL